jgi:hypothetical protein
MNSVSPCCHAEVAGDIRLEYPIGGRSFSIPYKVDRCQCCGKEVEDYAYACGVCGVVGCTGGCE